MFIKGVIKNKISVLGQYEGYSEPIYNGNLRTSQYLTMDDGVRIAVDYFLPTIDGKPADEKLPVIFHYTPYGRVMYGWEAREKFQAGDDDLYVDDHGLEGLMDIGRYGYVIATADVRGTGASFGVRKTTNSRREAADGKAIIEWLAAQPFCSGKVGMYGHSYTGQTQLECISMKPEHLKAAFVGMTDFNKYDGWMRGGISRAFGTQPDLVYGSTEEENAAIIDEVQKHTVPVDDDPEGRLLREALIEHMDNGLQIPLMKELKWRDAYLEASGGAHWNVISASTYRDDINASGVAAYIAGGNYDVFRKESIITYENLTVPKKLVIGPWYHNDVKVNVSWEAEMLRWFDYWLKGIENGIMDEDPVAFYVANYNFKTQNVNGPNTGYWRLEQDWPAQEGSRKRLYLSVDEMLSGSPYDNGALTEEPAMEAGNIIYKDPYGLQQSVESKLTTEEGGRGIDQVGLTFTSAPLKKSEVVIGHPMADITFSLESPGYMSENYDVDFFVSLSDYNPETEEAFLFGDGRLRASLRREEECPYDTLGLPWHRGNVGDNEYLELGKKYTLSIDLQPVSYLVRKGHCIRVTITNSMDRMYYSGRSAYEADPDCEKPVVKVYVGGDDGSKLILPNIYANR